MQRVLLYTYWLWTQHPLFLAICLHVRQTAAVQGSGQKVLSGCAGGSVSLNQSVTLCLSLRSPDHFTAVVFPLGWANRRNFRDKWVKATKKKQLIVSVRYCWKIFSVNFCWSLIYWSADKINSVNITLLMDKHWCYSFKHLTCDSLWYFTDLAGQQQNSSVVKG